MLFTLLIAIPTAYYFSLDRFSRVQQGEQSMIEQHNQNVEMNDEHKNQNVIEKIQNKLRIDPNNAETWLQLGKPMCKIMNLIVRLWLILMRKNCQAVNLIF